MTDIKLTEDILPMSEFRTNLAECAARVRETHRPLILTQNGRAASVFLDAADWEALMARVVKLEAMEDILAAEGDSERGETYTTEEVRASLHAVRQKASSPHKRKTSKASVAV